MERAEVLPAWVVSAYPTAPDAGSKSAPCLELAQRVAQGDTAAFEEIFRLHQRRVYALCLRMTQNAADADDLTQEVFILLRRKIGSYRGEASFTTWLHRLTVNMVLMHFRKKKLKREEQAENEHHDAPLAVRTSATRSQPLLDRIALDSALAQLPPGYRAAFVLHDIEGYDHEEAALILGCAAGTSKSQLHKARMKLRHILKGQR